jgi:hypothetical protein
MTTVEKAEKITTFDQRISQQEMEYMEDGTGSRLWKSNGENQGNPFPFSLFFNVTGAIDVLYSD